MVHAFKLIACGINHHKAPVHIREQVVFDRDLFPKALRDLKEKTQAREAMILSTCNRTEFYCVASQSQPIYDWLYQCKHLTVDLTPYWYSYENKMALRHLCKVVSGLDSMILGEPQILGQFKSAFFLAKEIGTIGTQLKSLFQTLCSVVKMVRTRTGVGRHPISLPFLVIHLMRRIFTQIQTKSVLLIGSGDTITRIAQDLRKSGITHFSIAARRYPEALIHLLQANYIPLTEISEHLNQFDIIMTATTSSLPLINKGMVENALKKRKRKPFFIMDLAVPRNIAPAVKELEDVYLYTLDDLQQIVNQNLMQRQIAHVHAEELIYAKVNEYLNSFRVRSAAPWIEHYRKKANMLRDEQLNMALNSLHHGESPEEVLKRMAHRLTNQLLHAPSIALRQAAYQGEEALTSLLELLNLSYGSIENCS